MKAAHITAILLGLASLFFNFSHPAYGQSAQYLVEPESLPPTQFFDADGNKRTFDEFKGKVVLVNFWATWCAPCVKEIPDLDQLQAKLGEEDFHIIAMSENGQDFDRIDAFAEEHNVQHLTFYDDRGSSVFFSLGLRGLPYSILLNKEGKIVARISGFIEWVDSDWPDTIRTFMAE